MGNFWIPQFDSASSSPSSTRPSSPAISKDSSNEGTHSGSTSAFSSSMNEVSPKIFSFARLKKATRKFSPDTLLGEGGFGQVFKGWIDEKTFAQTKAGTGMAIAVKKMNPESFQGREEWQLKDVAERKIPEGSVVGSKSSSVAPRALNVLNLTSSANHVSYVAASHESKPNDHLSNLPFRRGSESPTEEADWVERDEPGVYVTLSSLPGGGREIKRVRVSWKHFREQEAEKWWAENRARLFDKYDIHGEEDSITGSLSTSGDKNDATGQQYQST